MKRSFFYTVIGIVSLIGISLKAQVTLPYYSGFDNGSEQAGWTEYKKAATTFSHWSFNSANAYSVPNCVGHDYSPSTGITLTDNWFVSPAFIIIHGGRIDSIRYMFSGFSQPAIGDTIAIYLLNGSPDPALATSKQKLFDFRNADYVSDNTYRKKTNIILPPLTGSSYIAIRYRNTDCSSKWLTVNFDNIAISGNAVGINDLNTIPDKISIYPNPTTDKIIIESEKNINSIEIFNLFGETVFSTSNLTNDTSHEINFTKSQKGIYFVKIIEGEKTYTSKLIVN